MALGDAMDAMDALVAQEAPEQAYPDQPTVCDQEEEAHEAMQPRDTESNGADARHDGAVPLEHAETATVPSLPTRADAPRNDAPEQLRERKGHAACETMVDAPQSTTQELQLGAALRARRRERARRDQTAALRSL